MSPTQHKPLIIGHRGASATAPENTIVAFEMAMAAGADGVEFDVQLALDGVPVVIHDVTLKRTGLRPALVSRLTALELGKIDVGTWFNLRYPARAQDAFSNAKLPTLEMVLDFFKNGTAVLYVEMKCTDSDSPILAREVVRLVRKYQLVKRAVVASFVLDSIREIKRVDPEIRTAALFEPKLTRPVRSKRAMIERALTFQADQIALHRTLASSRAIEVANKNGLQVVVWTVDHPTWIRRAIDNGIYALITNEPARMSTEYRNLRSTYAQLSSAARPS